MTTAHSKYYKPVFDYLKAAEIDERQFKDILSSLNARTLGNLGSLFKCASHGYMEWIVNDGKKTIKPFDDAPDLDYLADVIALSRPVLDIHDPLMMILTDGRGSHDEMLYLPDMIMVHGIPTGRVTCEDVKRRQVLDMDFTAFGEKTPMCYYIGTDDQQTLREMVELRIALNTL